MWALDDDEKSRIRFLLGPILKNKIFLVNCGLGFLSGGGPRVTFTLVLIVQGIR